MVCHDATTRSFIAKFRGEIPTHFHAVSLKVTVVEVAVWPAMTNSCEQSP
jgi:hypothetical protein